MRWYHVVAVGALAFAIVTFVALEGVSEVVVVRTRDAAGAARDTRTWVAEDGGDLWIEAADPDRPFLLDVRREASVQVVRGGLTRTCTASIHDDPDGHRRIRQLLRAQYGWADWWIGLLADTRDSRALQLRCDT